MKFIFSLGLITFLYLFPAQAKEIILIAFHPTQEPVTKVLKKVLHTNMDFPVEMVEFREDKKPCLKKEVSAAHICIKENGEMEFPIVYTKTMKETLGVFWNETRDELENN
jgi:hypothetical protein